MFYGHCFFRIGDKILLTLDFIKNVWLLVLGVEGGGNEASKPKKKLIKSKNIKERKRSRRRGQTQQRKSP